MSRYYYQGDLEHLNMFLKYRAKVLFTKQMALTYMIVFRLYE